MRRQLVGVLAGTAGAIAAFALALPAANASVTSTTESAIASWQLGGSVAANISLQATEVSTPSRPTVFFFVSEQFCDVARSQEVYRSFSGQETAGHGLFTVSPDLAVAVLAVPGLRVTGTEQRLTGCTSPSGTPTTVSLGRSTISVFAGWQATGPTQVVQPGTVARPATAVGAELSAGPLNLGDLGQAQFAQIRRTTTP